MVLFMVLELSSKSPQLSPRNSSSSYLQQKQWGLQTERLVHTPPLTAKWHMSRSYLQQLGQEWVLLATPAPCPSAWRWVETCGRVFGPARPVSWEVLLARQSPVNIPPDRRGVWRHHSVQLCSPFLTSVRTNKVTAAKGGPALQTASRCCSAPSRYLRVTPAGCPHSGCPGHVLKEKNKKNMG